MTILIVAIVLLALLFLGYIIHVRRKVVKIKVQNEKSIILLRANLQHEFEQQRDAAMASVAPMEKTLEEKDSLLKDKDSLLKEKDSLLKELEEALRLKDTALSVLREESESKDRQMNALNDELEILRSSIPSSDPVPTPVPVEFEEQAVPAEEMVNETVLSEPEDNSAALVDEKPKDDSAALLDEQPEDDPTAVQDRKSEVIRSMRKMIIWQMETGQTLLELKGLKKGEIIPDGQWADLEQFLEQIDDHFVSRFSQKFPDFSEKDMRLMMLLRIRVPSKNIAMLYGINEKSVKQKLFLFKAKVGMESDPTSLRDYIEEF